MKFLVISQRAKSNPNFSLKDLPGHGRIDIVIRCILAATRKLPSKSGCKIYTYLKGSNPHGWLEINPELVDENDDEISLASKIKDNWNSLFTAGNLKDLLPVLDKPFVLLAEGGNREKSFTGTIVLGAQKDLAEEDISILPIEKMISLGKRSLLASHAIIYSRQLTAFS